eukprot:gnl/TRDRNA2_/TRDRNA2_130106_c1_seq1.p1 gnl/TRDRNA2_/TRDRNA2_130106_c1~~gnl/TRDRNA2_/TRDRNA2_130106_c1_seq1.p1  ORF type:complete len:355 (+),score=61.91 gnl/TRDRNA2_/TRDRNA2_130106_c1_seq1:36-1067(+)
MPVAPAARPSNFAAKCHSAAEVEAAKACECIPWQQAYLHHGVQCGQGLELVERPDLSKPLAANDRAFKELVSENTTQDANSLYSTRCSGFFHRINASTCVNQQFKTGSVESDPGSWCYVSAKCTQLNGGAAVPGTDVSVKACEKDKDIRMRDLSPGDLLHFALNHDLDPSAAANAAYLVVDEDVAAMSSGRLEQIKASRVSTHVFSTKSAWPEHRLISGKEVYKLEWRKYFATGVPLQMIRRRHHFRTVCEQGCSVVSPAVYEDELRKQEEDRSLTAVIDMIEQGIRDTSMDEFRAMSRNFEEIAQEKEISAQNAESPPTTGDLAAARGRYAVVAPQQVLDRL